jgi:hypothetical protein
MADMINSPSHYTAFPVEVIEITENLDFCRGNAVKYLCRAGLKSKSTELTDLLKAQWYINRAIDKYKREQAL